MKTNFCIHLKVRKPCHILCVSNTWNEKQASNLFVCLVCKINKKAYNLHLFFFFNGMCCWSLSSLWKIAYRMRAIDSIVSSSSFITNMLINISTENEERKELERFAYYKWPQKKWIFSKERRKDKKTTIHTCYTKQMANG